jgi:hypothetical protein
MTNYHENLSSIIVLLQQSVGMKFLQRITQYSIHNIHKLMKLFEVFLVKPASAAYHQHYHRQSHDTWVRIVGFRACRIDP